MASTKKAVKKAMEDFLDKNETEIDLQDKAIENLLDVPYLSRMRNITSLVLSHNRLVSLPPSLADLTNLENLNLFNNELETIPTTICNLPKLKFLNLALNHLKTLPKGFGACPMLEVLDLTYNTLNEASLSANFFYLEPLRALYLGDNEFEVIPGDLKHLKNLQVLVLRDNDLIELPPETGELLSLKELHLQNNRLQVLPPELGNVDLVSPKRILKAENNPWISEIADQFALGASHVMTYLKTDDYLNRFKRFTSEFKEPPPKKEREKSVKKKKEDKKK